MGTAEFVELVFPGHKLNEWQKKIINNGLSKYNHKIVKTTKDHKCCICGRVIQSKSFVVQTDERPNLRFGRVVGPFPEPPERAHLACFDVTMNPQGSGLEPTLSEVTNHA